MDRAEDSRRTAGDHFRKYCNETLGQNPMGMNHLHAAASQQPNRSKQLPGNEER